MSDNSKYMWVGGSKFPIKAWIRDLPVQTEGVEMSRIEDQALRQVMDMANMPFIHKHVAIMPDVHYGIGATVGSVIPTVGAIVPAAVGVDIGCFTGDTLVPTLDGKSYKIEDLVGKDELYIFAFDTADSTIKAAPARAVKTRKTERLLSITLDNGKNIKCTPDHLFLLRDGAYARADELVLGSSLMPFDMRIQDYARVKQPATRLSELNGNHMVVKIEELHIEETDVFCLQVPGYNNFALDSGCFVHNCGMMAQRLSIKASDLPDNLEKIRSEIERAVPHGMSKGRDKGSWEHVPASSATQWRDIEAGFSQIIEKHPKASSKNALSQLGTLGGGNHFIEVCLDEEDYVWVMLHSGSRGVGNTIGRYFIEAAKKEMEKYHILQNLPNKDLSYFVEHTEIFDDYVFAVHWAQDYAARNRQLMMDAVLRTLRKNFSFQLGTVAVNCHHNYVAIENHFGANVFVTRKGAVRAREGDLGIIPGSMGAKSFIVRGKGNPESFCSCSHGAGRSMSRTKAKSVITLEMHRAATEGIACRKDKDVIDESPAAYKSIDAVMSSQEDLVEVVHTLRQVVNIKG